MDIKQSSEKRFALLIDADNVSAKYIKPITDELSKYGTVTYKRIYGDWTLTLHAKWKDALLENSITPIQQFGYTQGKNATDSAMIIDAMDILYTRSVEGFCIVSSDSDFTRLASRIRESGLTVIGMGEKKTPTPFRKACDIFTTLELLLGESAGKSNGRGKGRGDQGGSNNVQSTGTSSLSKEEVEQAVVNIITDNQNNGKSTGLGEVGSRLLKRYPDFDVRSYGTNQLKKLLDEFQSVVITKDGSSVTVELAEDKDAANKETPVEDAVDQAQDTRERKTIKTSSRRQPRHRRDQTSAATQEKPLPGEAEADRDTGATPSESAQQPVVQEETSPEQKPTAEEKTQPQEVAEPQPVRARKPRRKTAARAAGAAQAQKAPTPVEEPPAPKRSDASQAPDQFIRQVVRESGADGVALSDLGKQVRAKFRNFKLRDLGYTQLRSYVADIDDVEIEKRGKDFYARLGE